MTWQKGKRWGLRVSHKELAHLGGMVFVEFEGYGALREVSEVCITIVGGNWRTMVVSRTTFVAIAARMAPS